MKILSFIILLLSIFNNILFYGRSYGINVICFIIPLLLFLYYSLKKKDMIQNKKGLLFLIPILLISCSYFIYDNYFFQFFNQIIITGLILLFYIYTIRPTYNLGEVIGHCISLVFDPLSKVGDFIESTTSELQKLFKVSDEKRRILKSFVIVIPIVIVVLILLSSADMIFGSYFKDIGKFFQNLSTGDIIGRCIWTVVLFVYFGSVMTYLFTEYRDTKIQKKPAKEIDSYTIKLLFISLNIIYVLFDFIQIRSLIFHRISMDIPYSTYARQGFFQLMAISVLNIIILLLSKRSKSDKFIKGSSILMVVLTFIIIVSSFLRMSMYEAAYGYTLLRLLVYVTLITESILLIPTIIYILKKDFNVFAYYLGIITCCYTILALFPVDNFIANNNIERYYKTDKIDVDYLMNSGCDNIPLLIELSDRME
ncbi:MAG: DUF4173 domain-containing protein, partial [Bacilli bacterium]|nr:DUF4173 domain-containing protein [Bacilli bacterium]